MKAAILIAGLGIALGGCMAQVPDSGVGFGDFAAFEMERANREAALTGTRPQALGPQGELAPLTFGGPVGTAVAATTPGAASVGGVIPSSALAAAGIGAGIPGAVTSGPLDATGLDPSRAGVQAAPGNTAPVVIASSGISDEQDFDAVASRESIESDAQRRAAQAAAYTVIQPTALPDAPADAGPNIVQYALSAPNRRGQEYYSRFAFSGQGRFERNCSEYRSPDEAQRDFLARGGPDRDPRGIDPDGDGFACGWDPAPYLLAVNN